MKNLTKSLCSIFLFSFLMPAFLNAAPAYLNYQGRLVDANGNPLSGTYSLTFRIYDAASAGTLIWNETQSLALDNGIFNASLGASTALAPSVFSSDTRYLEVQVGADSPMTPRTRLLSVPYSIYAASAAYAVGSDIADGQVTNAKIVTMAASKLTGALPAIDGSALTNLTAANISAGSLGAGVIASSVAVGSIYTNSIPDSAVTDAKIVGMSSSKLSGALPAIDGSALTGVVATNVTAAGVQAGSLGAGVIASSVAVNSIYINSILDSAVTDAKIAGMSSSKLSGALPAISGASLTTLTAANISAGSLGANVIASSVAVGSIYVNSILDSAVTDAKIAGMLSSKLSGALPAIDGSALTGIVATNVTAAGVQAGSLGASVIASSVAVGSIYTDSLRAGAVTDTKIDAGANISASKLGIGAVGNAEFNYLDGVTSAIQTQLDGKATLSGVNTWTSSQTVTAPLGVKVTYGVTAGSATITDATASALDVAGGINAGSGNVGIVDTTGKIPALSSTYLADVSGANLTLLNPANISAGSLGSGVIASSIAAGGVYTGAIAADAVTSAKVAADTLAAADIAAGAVESSEILDGTIDTVDIKDGAVTVAKISATAIIKLQDTLQSGATFYVSSGTVAGQFKVDDALVIAEGKLADSTVLSADIKDGEVASADIAADAVTSAKVAAAAVTSAKIATLDAALTFGSGSSAAAAANQTGITVSTRIFVASGVNFSTITP
ncbi:MAG: hypothetical protein HY796_07635, partial [Elusimicrobia bacterium]|nr:hypothetical protein [Elusimicrobiota bacterium]